MEVIVRWHVFCVLKTEAYTYYGTNMDNVDHLNYATNHKTSEIMVLAARFAGQMALRLIHDHLLSLDVNRYSPVLLKAVSQVYKRIGQLSRVGLELLMLLLGHVLIF